MDNINKIESCFKDTKELSNKFKITPEYWYMIRKGSKKPSANLIYEMSKIAKINFEELFIFFEKRTNRK